MNKDNPELLPQLRNLTGQPNDWKPNAAFAQLFEPDADLAVIVGPDLMTRAEFGKRLWDYIAKHDLQDALDRRVIHANKALFKICGTMHTNATELINSLLRHLK